MEQAMEQVRKARESFNRILDHKIYRDVIKDDKQLALLLEMVCDSRGNNDHNSKGYKKILDIGTGTGYLAFPLAEAYPQAMVYGIDIAESIIDKNRERVKSENIDNLSFQAFDGIHYPYEEERFDLVVSRYAFHHFPNPGDAVKQIYRILVPGGKVLISDPVRCREDQEGIIDDFMRIKGDGHIQFYTEAELERLFVERGFHKERVILTKMEFPFAPGQAYMELYEGLTDRERQLYDMAEKNGTVWVRHIAVGNTIFAKT